MIIDLRALTLLLVSIVPTTFSSNPVLFAAVNSHLVDTRLDPIVNPNNCSTHVHSVFGNVDFSNRVTKSDVTYNPTNPTNTSSNVLENMSMYWAPAMYILDPRDSVYHIIPSFNRVYYRMKYPGNNFTMVKPFPLNLRFVVGDASRKTDWGYEEEHDDIRWTLRTVNRQHTNYTHHGDWAYLRAMGEVADDQVEMNINFPNCLRLKKDGITPFIMSGDHRSHGTYTEGTTCPDDFPYHIPTVNLEVRYELDKMRVLLGDEIVNNVDNWRLSTGDASGAGAHADFISGWSEDLMKEIILHCRDAKGEFCPITKYFDQTRNEMNYKYVKPLNPIPDEFVTGIMSLPSGACPTGTIQP